MTEEMEKISDSTKVSFVCSFGYDIKGYTPSDNRMHDMYTFRNLDTHILYRNIRRCDFFKFIRSLHGGIRQGKKKLNACQDYDLFCYGVTKYANKWTRSRIKRDMLL
jgi:hypothetical protein